MSSLKTARLLMLLATLPACGGKLVISVDEDDAGVGSSRPDSGGGFDALVTPMPDASVTPMPDASVTPMPDASVTPMPDASVTPMPDASVTPMPDASVTPMPDASVTPMPDASVTPMPDAVVIAAPDANVSLDTSMSLDAHASLDAHVSPDATIPDAALLDVALLDAAIADGGTADGPNPCSLAPVDLGSAANFAVLAGATVTNTGPTMVAGDLGVSPGTAVTGFPPGVVVGTQHNGDPTAAQAQQDLTAAFDDAAGRTLCQMTVSGNLGGLTLTPGLYHSTSTLAISMGDLTLDAQGDPNAVFIFQMATSLTTTVGRQVILAGGAKSANIYWQVGSSATLGTNSVMHGTIMADQAITMTTGATITGRVLARVAKVALDSNMIVKPSP